MLSIFFQGGLEFLDFVCGHSFNNDCVGIQQHNELNGMLKIGQTLSTKNLNYVLEYVEVLCKYSLIC